MATFALPNVKPRVREIGNAVGNMFNVVNIGGWRPYDSISQDHPNGIALDYMVYSDKAKGDAIAKYHVDNAASLGIKYIIWYRKSWNPSRGTWADYSGSSNPHTDHVHVSYLESASGSIPGATNLGLKNPVDDIISKLPVLKEVEKMATFLNNPLVWRRAGIGALGILLALIAMSFIRRMNQ